MGRYTWRVIHIFYGADTYSRTRATERLLQEVAGDGADVLRLDAGVAIDELTFALQTTPFLAERRVVIVDGLLARAQPARRDGRARGGGRRGAGTPFWAPLADIAAALPPTTELILIDGELDGDNPLRAALAPNAKVSVFPPLRGRDLQGWIVAHAREKGVRIQPNAQQLLLQLCGPNLWAIASEIEKLRLYLGDERPATAEDVRALAASVREESVFSLVDAIVEGRSRDALRLLEQLRADGAAGPYLITMIARQCRLLILARELSSGGLAQQDIGRRIGVTHEFALGKIMTQASRANLAWLEAAMSRLLEADLAVKRGEQGEDLALELLIADLAS